ncbi:hypothetical protein JMJ77_0011859 [Colletotrichum scovillei]|nr:hypothetical protein JMJ76_0005954 [Colletotrichum scovillei]KAH8421659.1 hypothetical protein JMJ77_0011859 [Colletotrichum scovillei]KAH8421840.1 hypothetical protein JMJ78_0011212 [Colletotrichum scovillei]
MSRHFLFFAVLCWIAAHSAIAARVAVVLTDSKMDDKAGIAVALMKTDAKNPAKPQYDRVILVFTGAEERSRMGLAMSDYLTRAEKHQPALPAGWESRTAWFQTKTNVLGQAAPHESWYKNLRPTKELPVATGESLAAEVAKVGRGSSVDIFQVAPCEDNDVWEFIDALPNINVYHLFFGYNSRQGIATDDMTRASRLALSQRQVQFHKTLQARLSDKHLSARVIFTQNVPSFANAGAGSQELSWCRKYFPEEDILMALRDPFWTGLITLANKYADEATKLQQIRASPEEFMTQVVSSRLEETTLRVQILKMLKSAISNQQFAQDSPRSYSRVRDILVEEFTGNPAPTLELGDANHMAIVLQYLDNETKDRNSYAMRLLPALCDTSEENPTQPPRVSAGAPAAQSPDGWVLAGCNIHDTRRYIEGLFQENALP